MDNGDTKDDLRLPTDEQLLTQVSRSVLGLFDSTFLLCEGCKFSLWHSIGGSQFPALLLDCHLNIIIAMSN